MEGARKNSQMDRQAGKEIGWQAGTRQAGRLTIQRAG